MIDRRILLTLPIAFVLLSACTEKKRAPEPPRPVVAASSTSPFDVARGGTDPAFKTKDGALWVFTSPGSGEGAERTLAGLSLGDAKGPRYGLLGGGFAPLVATADSTRSTSLALATTKDGVVATFGSELAVLVRPPHDGRVSIVLRGPAVVLVGADRTEVRASLAGAPTAALQISAGDAPEILVPRADHLELTPRAKAAITLDTSCAPGLVRPVPRGSTSVFAIHLGGLQRAASDPLFGAEGRPIPDALPCSGTATSTLTLAWP